MPRGPHDVTPEPTAVDPTRPAEEKDPGDSGLMDDTAAWTPPPTAMWEEITVVTTHHLPEVRTQEPTARDTLQVLESKGGSADGVLEWRSEIAADASDTLSGLEEDLDTAGLVAVGAAVTHAGLVRDGNEDAYLVWPEVNLAVVADGMGGHQAGEVASALAVDHIRETLVASGTPTDTLDAQMLLVRAIREANDRICALSETEASLQGMGTTVVALWMIGHMALAVHVGDSRLYQIRDFEMTQITRDHSLLNELRKHGIVNEAQAASDPRRHVLTRALGGRSEFEADATVLDLRPGDRFVLCTDGLTDIVEDSVIRTFGGSPRPPSAAAHARLEAALPNGGKDNVPVVVVEVESAD